MGRRMKLSIGPTASIAVCTFFTVLYVGSLYIWIIFDRHQIDRDNPKTIVKRFASVIMVSLIAPCIIPFFAEPVQANPGQAAILGGGEGPSLASILGVRTDNLLPAVLWPFLHVVGLFAGSIYMK